MSKHVNISAALSATLVQSGTVVFTYPDGYNKGDFVTFGAEMVTGSNDVFSVQNGDITIALGDTSVTVTLRAATSIPAGTPVTMGLKVAGVEQFTELRENKTKLSHTTKKESVQVNLGNPVAVDTDGILDGVSATTTAQSYTIANFVTAFANNLGYLDVPRNLTMTGSSGSNHVVTVTGEDIYGDVIVENFTLSGTTNIIGNKAFYRVTNVAVAAGASGDTVDVGWGVKLGLPIFLKKWNDIKAQYVDGELIATDNKVRIDFNIEATELAAGTSEYVASPVYGFVSKATTVVQTGVGTGGAITVEIATAAVAGLSVVVASSASVGDIDTDTPTAEFGPTGEIAKDGAIEIVVASAFATSGALNGFLEVTPGGAIAVGSEVVATATTGDVRGTFTPPVALTPNGSRTYILEVETADAGYVGIDNYDAV